MTHVAVITPTRDRHRLLPLIERWVRRQSVPLTWIVSEDSETKADNITPDVHVHYQHPEPPDFNTIAGNILRAIDHLPDEATHVAFMEDDDWYHASYLELMARGIPTGTKSVIQYTVTARAYREPPTPERRRSGMLCNTVLPIAYVEAVREAAEWCRDRGKCGVDLRLWALLRDGPRQSIQPDRPIQMSFKAFPEDSGILRGFTRDHLGLEDLPYLDKDFELLRFVLGDDLEHYIGLIPGLEAEHVG